MEPVQKIKLRTSIANKALKRMKQRYPGGNERDLRIGLLGEYAVVEHLRQQSFSVMHNSLAEMQFSAREGSTDIYYYDDIGIRTNIQVKATEHDTCWIKSSCLRAYLTNGVDEIYFVDVKINGNITECFIYLRISPQTIKKTWLPIDRNIRLVHPTYHRNAAFTGKQPRK